MESKEKLDEKIEQLRNAIRYDLKNLRSPGKEDGNSRYRLRMFGKQLDLAKHYGDDSHIYVNQ